MLTKIRYFWLILAIFEVSIFISNVMATILINYLIKDMKLKYRLPSVFFRLISPCRCFLANNSHYLHKKLTKHLNNGTFLLDIAVFSLFSIYITHRTRFFTSRLLKTGGYLTKITLVDGDITLVSANALITAVRSLRHSNDPVDEAIKQVAGSVYHDAAIAGNNLKQCRLVIAKSGVQARNDRFNIVIFLLDDLKQPLSEMVKHALDCAATGGFRTVSLPIIRSDLPRKAPERTITEVIDGLALGIAKFREEYDGGLDAITVVTHGHTELLLPLTAKFAELKLL